MINKLIITAIATLGIAFTAEAQTFSIGPRVGATFATINSTADLAPTQSLNQRLKPGLQFGAVANFAFNDRLSVQPELLMVQKGSKGESKQTVDVPESFNFVFEAESRTKNTYIELPVLAKLYFGTGKLKSFVTAGPTFGYWLRGRTEADITITTFEGEEAFVSKTKYEKEVEFNKTEELHSIDGTDLEVSFAMPDYKRFETGASFGVGAAYEVGSGTVNLDVRYGLGFSSMYDDSDEKTKNRVFGASLAYLFSL